MHETNDSPPYSHNQTITVGLGI